MSTIAYTVAIALVGTSAAVGSQLATATDAPLQNRLDIQPAQETKLAAYDLDKFSAKIEKPDASAGNQSVSVRVATIAQDELRIIVRDAALAEKADNLAAAVDVQQLDAANFQDIDDEIASVHSLAVPLPKTRPIYSSLEANPAKIRKNIRRKAATKRKTRKRVRVAEANTSRQSKLARRLRTRGWLIGAFR